MSVRSRHLIAYASSMIALLLVQILFSTKAVATLSDLSIDIVYTLLSQVLCMGVVPLVVLLILRRDVSPRALFTEMRYAAPRDKKATLLVTLGIMVLITPFTMAFNAVSNLFFSIIGYKRAASIGTIYLGVGDLFFQLFLTALLPAVFEEFTHRGVLLTGLEDRGSEYTAVIGCGVLFGLMHGNPLQMLYATFGGFLFALLVWKTGSVLPAMCAHFANNAVAVLLDYSTQRETAFGVWYDKVTGANNALGVLLLVAVMALSVYAVILLLQYLVRKNEKPISPRKFLGVVSVDGYKPNGKATLRDNAALYAVLTAETALTLFLIIWGIAR